MSTPNKENYKDKLFNFEVEVDNDALWNALEKHVPVKEKKRRLFIWWFLGGFILLGIIGWGINNLITNSKEKINIVTKSNSIETFELASNEDENSNSSLTKNNMKIVIEDKLDTEKTTQNASINRKTKVDIFLNHSKRAFENKPTNAESYNPANTTNLPSKKQTITPLENAESIHQSPPLLINQVAQNNRKPIEIKIIPSKTSLLSFTDQPEMDFIINPIKNRNNHKWWIKNSIGFGTTNITHEIQAENSTYKNQLEESFSSLPSISASIAFGIDLSRKWSLFSGINYDRYVTKLSIHDNEIIESQSSGTVSTTIDPNGIITNVEGELSTKTYRDYNAEWYSYHHIINMPVGVVYNFINLDKLSLGAKLGFSINLFNTHDGALLNTNNTLLKYNRNSHPYQLRLINPMLGLQAQYRINPSFVAGVGFDISSQSLKYSISDIDINENYLNKSIQIFYQYQF